MDESVCQSPSSPNSAQNNLRLSAPETENEDKRSESAASQKKLKQRCEAILQQETYTCSSMVNLRYHITESLFKDFHKSNGHIAIPITYLAEHCIDQFTIIGLGRDGMGIHVDKKNFDEVKKQNPNCRPSHIRLLINGKYIEPYNRIIIQRKPIKE